MFAKALYSTIKEWMIFETDHLYYEMVINVLEISVGLMTPPPSLHKSFQSKSGKKPATYCVVSIREHKLKSFFSLCRDFINMIMINH